MEGFAFPICFLWHVWYSWHVYTPCTLRVHHGTHFLKCIQGLTSCKPRAKYTHSLVVQTHQVMFDTVGPELQIINKGEAPINLVVDEFVVLTPDATQQASSTTLPVNYPELASVSMPFMSWIDLRHPLTSYVKESKVPKNQSSEFDLVNKEW